jgi:[ribosomal protein S18]-alanine N-acetyltransferase
MVTEIREMQLADLPEVLRNERRGYAHPWSEGIFKGCLTGSNECWLLVFVGRIVGHAIISVAAGESHLLNVCIHPEEQGNGYGRKLVEHALIRARANKASIMFLEVRPSNQVACDLYAKLGFNEVGTRANYYPSFKGREDAIVLAKELLD